LLLAFAASLAKQKHLRGKVMQAIYPRHNSSSEGVVEGICASKISRQWNWHKH